MNKGCNFLGGSFSNRENVRAQIQFRRRVHPSIAKDDFSSRKDQSIFISIAPMFLDWSTETRLVNHSVAVQIQKPILVVATDQMPDHIWSRE